MAMRMHGGGWFTLAGRTAPEGTDGLHLRVRRNDDGRLTITDVYVHGAAITNDALRGISASRLEASLTALESALHQKQPGYDLLGDPKDYTLNELRKEARKEARRDELHKSDRPKLHRPDGTDPEGFYRLVARAYIDYAAESKAAAKAIATEASVPVTTAHRWVREARLRGFLPAGRKGRVG